MLFADRHSQSDDEDLPPHDSRYYYGGTHPTLAGAGRVYVNKKQQKRLLVNNAMVPKLYESNVRVSQIGSELKPGSFVSCLDPEVTGTIEKISKHKNVQARYAVVREKMDHVAFDAGKVTCTGWTKKIKYKDLRPIFRKGIYIRKIDTKQWFQVKEARPGHTLLFFVLKTQTKEKQPGIFTRLLAFFTSPKLLYGLQSWLKARRTTATHNPQAKARRPTLTKAKHTFALYKTRIRFL